MSEASAFETFYYTTPKPEGEKYYPTPEVNKNQVAYDGPVLTRGVDYEVVDANGNVLQPDSDGAFVMTWPNAKKGDQNIYSKGPSRRQERLLQPSDFQSGFGRDSEQSGS